MSESRTPRTDACTFWTRVPSISSDDQTLVVPVEFAQSLEEEINGLHDGIFVVIPKTEQHAHYMIQVALSAFPSILLGYKQQEFNER
jgi:homogentisate 1,2-dioxygenase